MVEKATCFKCECCNKLVLAHYKIEVANEWVKQKSVRYLCEEHLMEYPEEIINDAEKIHKDAVDKSKLIQRKRMGGLR